MNIPNSDDEAEAENEVWTLKRGKLENPSAKSLANPKPQTNAFDLLDNLKYSGGKGSQKPPL